MKTFTEKELFDWMNEQPDERAVDMGNPFYHEQERLCLMSQFLKEKGIKVSGARRLAANWSEMEMDGTLKNHGSCFLSDTVLAKIELEKCIFNYFTADLDGGFRNFGCLKKSFLGLTPDKN